MQADFRIGTGYDVHRLAEERTLWLGGVQIPFAKGCVAHSDGDVLLHAVCDALLGALALGDIGGHFPDNDAQYKNISSIILLKRVYDLVIQKGFRLVNMDATILLQEPKITPYVVDMRNQIAQTLGVEIEAVSIKATTTEGLGFIGHGEGVAAQGVVMLRHI